MDQKTSLDAIDRHILEILQTDASLSVSVIGERVGLSTNPCWRRIRRLEETGVIKRRVAIVDQEAIGLPLTAFVSIRTDKHNAEWLATLAKGVRAIPEIVECHRMSGNVDYVLKVVARDIAHYDQVYKRLIAEVPGLSDVSTTFSMERLKFSTALDLRST